MPKNLNFKSALDLLLPPHPKKVYILFHAKRRGLNSTEFCRDGIAAAWMLQQCINEVARHIVADPEIDDELTAAYEPYISSDCADMYCYAPCDYGQASFEFGEGHIVYLVDYSVPMGTIKRWQVNGAWVKVFDHHKSFVDKYFANKTLPDLLSYDLYECGATLVYKEFEQSFPDIFRLFKFPDFLFYVRDRDLGENSLRATKEVNAAMTMMRETVQRATPDLFMLSRKDINPFFYLHDYWNDLSAVSHRFVSVMERMGECVLVAQAAEIEVIKNQCLADSNSGFYEFIQDEDDENAAHPKTLIYFTHLRPEQAKYTSDVGQALINRLHVEDGLTHAAVMMVVGGSKVELRAGTGQDVLAIAKALGGGGHPQACGAPLDTWKVERMVSTEDDYEGPVLSLCSHTDDANGNTQWHLVEMRQA